VEQTEIINYLIKDLDKSDEEHQETRETWFKERFLAIGVALIFVAILIRYIGLNFVKGEDKLTFIDIVFQLFLGVGVGLLSGCIVGYFTYRMLQKLADKSLRASVRRTMVNLLVILNSFGDQMKELEGQMDEIKGHMELDILINKSKDLRLKHIYRNRGDPDLQDAVLKSLDDTTTIKLLGTTHRDFFHDKRIYFNKFKDFCEEKDDSDNRCIFSWNKLSDECNKKLLIEFLEKKYKIDWVKSATIEVYDKIVNFLNRNHSISLQIDIDKSEVILRIDGSLRDYFIAKNENGNINIYELNARVLLSDPFSREGIRRTLLETARIKNDEYFEQFKENPMKIYSETDTFHDVEKVLNSYRDNFNKNIEYKNKTNIHNKYSIDLRFYENYPSLWLIITDNEVYLQFYQYGTNKKDIKEDNKDIGEYFIIMVFERGEVYELLSKHFEQIWNEAKNKTPRYVLTTLKSDSKETNGGIAGNILRTYIEEELSEDDAYTYCENCGYIYDPNEGKPNIAVELSDDWICPRCNEGKDAFTQFQ
jgi:rubredoxin